MREIKFRGRKSNGEWIYGDLVTTETTDGISTKKQILPFDAVIFDNTEEVEENTIGQFTGLHDKNGKEIYEGDVVKWTMTQNEVTEDGGYREYDSDEIGEVEWCKDALYVGEYCAVGFSYESEDYAEVIGNIHDNPELLNK